jgi:hypothetical protein
VWVLGLGWVELVRGLGGSSLERCNMWDGLRTAECVRVERMIECTLKTKDDHAITAQPIDKQKEKLHIYSLTSIPRTYIYT